MLKWKCNKLEEQLDQFKNRKTQYGGIGNIGGIDVNSNIQQGNIKKYSNTRGL